jgi:hypothetical protein
LAELRDSSLLFSLESLMQEERSRVDAERAQKEERERVVAAERQSRVRLREQEDALREARERDRLVEEERRAREEEARLEGIRTAEIERVRSEAARRAAHESQMMQRKHELELAAIRRAASARVTRTALAGTSVVAFVACTALAWRELGVHPERIATMSREHATALGGERARAAQAQGELEKSEARRRELESELRARPVAAPPAPTPPAVAPSTRWGRGPTEQRDGRARPKPGKPGAPCVDDGDPMNPCLAGSRLR